MIKIKDLKFKYSNSPNLTLDIPEFNLPAGEKVFLFGPSGCGKTTFLEIIAGIHQPLEGSIEIANHNLMTMTAPQKDQLRADQMGYIFQSFNLIPYLSVIENITLPLYFSSKKRTDLPQHEEIARTQRLCSFLGISELLNRRVTELSVGQQQRVAAARAVIGNPKLILADEPTSALDYSHREKFIELLFQLCTENKTSVLFVSHDRSLEKLFDRSVSLFDLNKASRAESEYL